MIKPIYLSKTVLYNLITLLVLVLPVLADHRIVPLEFAALAITLINIVLRVWFTAAPLTEQAANKEADRIVAQAEKIKE